MSASPPVLCLDFDGVVCDSCAESAVAGWKHARALWPELLPDGDWRPFLAPMRRLRPVVHTGFEQTLLIRLLAEGQPGEAEILAGWPAIMARCMADWGLERAALVEGFGAVRDRWIAADPEGWVGMHAFYAPVIDCLRASSSPAFVITTKQARFCARLLRSAGVELPPERLFGLEAGPKADVLAALLAREGPAVLHFVEDNLDTLEKVAAARRLDEVRLYLADWGYNTEAMRRRAAANPRIEVISTADLAAIGR